MLTIGLIGCGNWGRHILRDLKALGCRVAVVARSAASRARAEAGEANQIVPAIERLPALDGAVVAVTTVAHAKVLLELLDRNTPLFCEKPLTADVASAAEIVRRGGERVFVMDKWRYHGGIEALAAIARTDELGPVLGLKTRRLGWGNPHSDVDASWILLPHDLSIALEILGEMPRPVRAAAECDARGLVALSGWLEGPAGWLHCEIGARSPEHLRSVELRCRDGIAVLDGGYETHIRVLRTDCDRDGHKQPSWQARPVPAAMPLYTELAAFVAYLKGGPPPRSSAAEGLRTVETISALRRLAGLERS